MENPLELANLREKFRNWWYKDHTFLLSFLIPAIILEIAFLSRYTFPLGNRDILIIDLYHQYAPFLSGFRNKLLTFGNLMYSWLGGLGTSFIPLIGYYLASPLNLIVLIFPKNMLTESVLVLILVKTGLSGACFAYFLNFMYKRKGLMAIAFSTLYALSGFMLAYFWNIMWLDAIYLLPLIIMGLVRLVQEGRYLLYTLSLGLLLFANFYIAFFVCLFVLIYFPIILAKYQSFKKPGLLFKRVGQFAVFSLLAAGLSAILLVPTFDALRLTSAYGEHFPRTLSTYFDIFDFFSRHLAITGPSIREGLPNLYCGVAALIMLPVFYLSRSIPLKEKISNTILLLIMIVSFNTNVLNFIWHGFHFPNQLPYRNSFVYIFVVVSMAFNASGRLREFTGRQIGAVCAAVMAFVLIAQKLDDNAANPVFIYVNIAIIIMYTAVLTLHKRRRDVTDPASLAGCTQAPSSPVLSQIEAKPQVAPQIAPQITSQIAPQITPQIAPQITPQIAPQVAPQDHQINGSLDSARFSKMLFAFFIAIILEVTANTIVTMDRVDNNEHFSYRNGYLTGDDTKEVEKALKTIAASDKGFYRMEMHPPKTTNDSFLYNYRGIEIFASTFQEKPVKLIQKLGFHSNGINSYQYEGSTLVLDSLFGVKYLIRRSGDIEEYLRIPFRAAAGSQPQPDDNKDTALIKVYENPYALEIGFMAPADFKEWNSTFANPFITQNSIMAGLSGVNGIIVPLELTETYKSNITITKSSKDSYKYKKSDVKREGNITLQLTVTKDQQVCLYVETTPKQFKSAKAVIGDRTIGFNAQRSSVVDLGYFHEGDVIDIQLVLSKDSTESGNFQLSAGALDLAAFEKAFSYLKEQCIKVDSFNDTTINGHIDAASDGTMVMTIPYDKGWHVRIDGKEVETYAIDDCLLSFDIASGNHTVDLEFVTDKLVEGLLITVLSLTALLLALLYTGRSSKRKPI